VQVSGMAPISTIPVHGPSHDSRDATGPADDRLLAGWLVVPAYAAFGMKGPPVQIAFHFCRCPILGANRERKR
jgi:hypothetical protein